MGATSAFGVAVLAMFLFVCCETKAELVTCTCTLFPANNSINEPLMNLATFHLKHGPEGCTNCKDLCIAEMEVTIEEAPDIICENVEMPVYKMKPAVFAKCCADYEYTGMTSSIEICCNEEGFAIECAD